MKPYDKIKFTFTDIDPALAEKYLAASKGNRRLKTSTVDSYARDMANGEWLTNHQGIAFDENGRLIDGHHRLSAVVQSRHTVTMLVSTGWPAKVKHARAATMDTVDRGCVRSLRDQLELQHGINDARDVVQLAGALAAIIAGHLRVAKQSTSTVLRIVELYQPEFQWFTENACRTQGLRSVNLSAVVVMGMVSQPEPTKRFYEQLKTGLNLSANSPIYHLRNYLLSLRGGNNYDDKLRTRQAAAHHLALFVAGKPCGSLVSGSIVALNSLIAAQGERAKIICGLWGGAPLAARVEEDKPPSNSGARWDSPAALQVLKSFPGSFSVLDLSARLDGGQRQANTLLAEWIAHGLATQASFGQFRAVAK